MQVTSPTFVLVTGPAGSGKSSAAAAWAAQGTATRALLNVDELRTLTKAGFAHPEHGWTDETDRQWRIAFELCAAMVRVYQANGVSAIIDVYAPPFPEGPWAELVTELGATRITLLPRLDFCLTRNAERAREPFLQDPDLRQNYAGFGECVALYGAEHLLDNSILTVQQVAEHIDAVVGLGR